MPVEFAQQHGVCRTASTVALGLGVAVHFFPALPKAFPVAPGSALGNRLGAGWADGLFQNRSIGRRPVAPPARPRARPGPEADLHVGAEVLVADVASADDRHLVVGGEELVAHAPVDAREIEREIPDPEADVANGLKRRTSMSGCAFSAARVGSSARWCRRYRPSSCPCTPRSAACQDRLDHQLARGRRGARCSTAGRSCAAHAAPARCGPRKRLRRFAADGCRTWPDGPAVSLRTSRASRVSSVLAKVMDTVLPTWSGSMAQPPRTRPAAGPASTSRCVR